MLYISVSFPAAFADSRILETMFAQFPSFLGLPMIPMIFPDMVSL